MAVYLGEIEMLKFIVALIILLGVGCASTGEPETDIADLLCSGPDSTFEVGRIGDQIVLQGRLFVVEERYEFRPCDKAETYILVTTAEFEDALSPYTANLHDADSVPTYVRFNGYELVCEGVLPDPYSGVVKAMDHQATSAKIPANCN
jgi:hypothetical protein